jgi:hypothetical protein
MTTFLVGSESQATDAGAEQPGKHRIFAGVGDSAVWFRGGHDGHMEESGLRLSGSAGYAYQFVRRLELGGDVTVFPGRYSYVLPGVRVRGYLPIGSGDPVEIGLSGRIAVSVMSNLSYTWVGFGYSLGPDVRVWLSNNVGLQVSGEASANGGSTSGENTQEYYDYHTERAGLFFIGGSLSVLFRI